MGLYRTFRPSFWSDGKIANDFTPEERYFYLYLLTNEHTNLLGCYEIVPRQMTSETGYSEKKVTILLENLCIKHKVVSYCKDTKELLIFNWSKYNWTKSEKLIKSLEKSIAEVKCPDFKRFLLEKLHPDDTLSIPYTYPMDTVSNQYGYGMHTTDSVTVSDSGIKDSDSFSSKNDISNDNVHSLYDTNNRSTNDITNSDIDEVVSMYNEICVDLPRVQKMTEVRKKHVAARIRQFGKDTIREALEKTRDSDFLSGRTSSWRGATFDWLMEGDSHMVKVLEGNYENKKNTAGSNSGRYRSKLEMQQDDFNQTVDMMRRLREEMKDE